MVKTAAPTPEEIKAARVAAGLTQAEAAALVHRKEYRRWNEWENGRVPMPAAEWELFNLKAKVVDSGDNKK
jgi:putative transcriptional regulator